MALKIQNQYQMTCPRRVETILQQELKEFGIGKVTSYSGGVSFQTTPQKALRTILQCRTADRLYKVLFKFKIKNEEELYRKAVRLPWDEVLGLKDTFKIITLVDFQSSRIFKNTMFTGLKLKDAIADHFNRKFKKRPDVKIDNPSHPIKLHIEKSKERGSFFVTIALDLCGTPLSQRGYRKESNDAPLRENLAAALIMATDWDSTSDEQLMDPMCGSGTILIEAALMRLQVTPSYLKLRLLKRKEEQPWCFLRQAWFKKNRGFVSWFKKESSKFFERNEKQLSNATQANIVGSELTQETLKTCKMNLRRAAVFKVIEVKQMDATQLSPKLNRPGIILTNPPYGMRMGEIEKLKKLYHDFAEQVKQNFKATRLYIFTGNPELRKEISLQTSKRIPFYNGAIECRLLRYEIH